MSDFKRPESVLVVIYTANAEVLLMQRQDVTDFWQSVTGSLDANEQAWQTAQREVFEETGIDVGAALQDCQQQNRYPIIEPWRSRYTPDVTHNTEYVFRLCLPTMVDVQLNPREHSAYQWLPKTVALQRASSDTNRRAIEEWAVASVHRENNLL